MRSSRGKLWRVLGRIIPTLAGLLSPLAGCNGAMIGASHSVGVSSFAGPPPPAAARYVLLPDMPGVPAGDLQFQEVCDYIRAILAARGMVEAPTMQTAQLAVFVAYWSGAPIHQTFVAPAPVMSPLISGRGTERISGSVIGPNGTYFMNGTVTTNNPGAAISEGGARLAAGIAQYRQSKYGTLYSYFLRLEAVNCDEFRRTRQIVYYWQATAATADPQGDLRAEIPVLAAALGDYVGRSSGRVVWLRIADNDPRNQSLQVRKLAGP
jgi:hypothetical protein